MKASRLQVLLWALFLAYVACVAFLVSCHEPWIDELNAWRIAKNYSVSGIFALMHVEGHFVLWYLLLYPFAHVFKDPIWLGVVSGILMSVSTYLLIFKSNFTLDNKGFIVFCYANLYAFPVVSRCYAMIPLLLFALAYYYSKRHQSALLYGLLLGLLANTHLYMEGFYLALLSFMAWDIYQYRSQWEKEILRKNVWGFGIALLGGIMGFVQVIGAFFDERSRELIGGMAQSPVSYFSPLIETYTMLPVRGTILWGIVYVIIIGAVGCCFAKAFGKNRRVLIIWIVSIAYQVLFALCIAGCNFQRYLLPLYITVFCFWICEKNKYIRLLTILFCTTTSIYGYHYIYNDVVSIGAPERSVYNYVQEHPSSSGISSRRNNKETVPVYAIESAAIVLECFSETIDHVNVQDIDELSYMQLPDSVALLDLTFHANEVPKRQQTIMALSRKGYQLTERKQFHCDVEVPYAGAVYTYYQFEKSK